MFDIRLFSRSFFFSSFVLTHTLARVAGMVVSRALFVMDIRMKLDRP